MILLPLQGAKRRRTRQQRAQGQLRRRAVRVRGHDKVFCHLMFGILALAAEQLMRLVT